MRLSFLGAAKVVTGSAYLLEAEQSKILVDFGMFQGRKEIRDRNEQPLLFNPAEIDYLLLTHAHIDHSGLIPRLQKEGFQGKVIATKATVDLCRIMLPDSGHIQEMEIEWENRKRMRAGKPPVSPLYTVAEAEQSLALFTGVSFNEIIELNKNFKVRFRDAGHILGSSILEIWVSEAGEEIKIVFSGDLGNTNQPIVNDPTFIEEADYLVLESTYGNRLHETTQAKVEHLAAIIEETRARGGKIVIPAFAIERTQEILYYLNDLIENKTIEPIPVYVDSPLAISATQIFKDNFDCTCVDEEMQQLVAAGDDPFWFPGLRLTRTAEESRQINMSEESAVIIAASGMCDAGRIKHHLKHNLWRPESSIVFVGYQAAGTLGRAILDGAKKVKIFGEEISVSASIHVISGFSAHADQQGLLRWLQNFKRPPKKVFLVHGEEDSIMVLAQKIQQELGLATFAPEIGDSVKLTPQTAEALQKLAPPVVRPVERDAVIDQIDRLVYYAHQLRRSLASGEPVKVPADFEQLVQQLLQDVEKVK